MASSKEINENLLKKITKKIFSFIGYKIIKINNFNERYEDFIAEASKEELNDIKYLNKIALSSQSNLWSIIQSLKHIKKKKIEGDIIECGVYKGGSLALLSKYSKKLLLNCKIIGFDTFENGFSNSKLTIDDVTIKGKRLNFSNEKNIKNFYPSMETVKKNILNFSKNYNNEIVLIKGDVLETLNVQKNIPEKISFLRLDTDLYTTTKKQLEVLYPKLVKGGILHIDDYGFLPGVRKAVDEYFLNEDVWLHRVDLTCRLIIKN